MAPLASSVTSHAAATAKKENEAAQKNALYTTPIRSASKIVYDQAHAYAAKSTFVQKGLSLVQPLTSRVQPYIQPHVEQATEIGDPIISKVDEQLHRVIEELQRLQGTLPKPSDVTHRVNSSWQSVLVNTQNAVDYVIPSVETGPPFPKSAARGNGPKISQPLTVSSVRTHVRERLSAQATKQAGAVKSYGKSVAGSAYGTVKTFSAQHVQPVLTIDPVAILEPRAVATLEGLKGQLEELTAGLSAWTSAQKERVAGAKAAARTQVDNARQIASRALPAGLHEKVVKLHATLTDLNLQNLHDIQSRLAALRELLANSAAEVEEAVAAKSEQFSESYSIPDPVAPLISLKEKYLMFTSPVKGPGYKSPIKSPPTNGRSGRIN